MPKYDKITIDELFDQYDTNLIRLTRCNDQVATINPQDEEFRRYLEAQKSIASGNLDSIIQEIKTRLDHSKSN